MAGAATGVIVARASSRLLATAAVKTAAGNIAKAVAARAGGRLAGGLAGGAAGAAAGSAVPGAGTAAGAVVGFLVGVATATGVDKAFLALEEGLHRDKFKAEILESLHEVRDQLREPITAPQVPAMAASAASPR